MALVTDPVNPGPISDCDSRIAFRESPLTKNLPLFLASLKISWRMKCPQHVIGLKLSKINVESCGQDFRRIFWKFTSLLCFWSLETSFRLIMFISAMPVPSGLGGILLFREREAAHLRVCLNDQDIALLHLCNRPQLKYLVDYTGHVREYSK